MMSLSSAHSSGPRAGDGQNTSNIVEQKIEAVIKLLEYAYDTPRHGNLDDPLDELIYIKLSQQTNAAKFRRVFEQLKRQFGGWDGLREAGEAEIEEVIRPLGFHRQRAVQLKATLEQIAADRESLDLAWLREVPVACAVAYLTSLPGVGIKTAYCVAMYSLGAEVLPVDTHVERVSSRLGLVSTRLALHSRQGNNLGIHRELEQLIPSDKRYSFHVNCVAHGRAVCTTKRPKCEQCIISAYCDYYSQPYDKQKESAAQIVAELKTSAADAVEGS